MNNSTNPVTFWVGSNQLKHTHREAYALYRSDALQRALDRRFREREPLIPTLPDNVLD